MRVITEFTHLRAFYNYNVPIDPLQCTNLDVPFYGKCPVDISVYQANETDGPDDPAMVTITFFNQDDYAYWCTLALTFKIGTFDGSTFSKPILWKESGLTIYILLDKMSVRFHDNDSVFRDVMDEVNRKLHALFLASTANVSIMHYMNILFERNHPIQNTSITEISPSLNILLPTGSLSINYKGIPKEDVVCDVSRVWVQIERKKKLPFLAISYKGLREHTLDYFKSWAFPYDIPRRVCLYIPSASCDEIHLMIPAKIGFPMTPKGLQFMKRNVQDAISVFPSFAEDMFSAVMNVVRIGEERDLFVPPSIPICIGNE